MEVSVGRQPKGQLWLVLAVLVAFAMLGEAARSLPPPSLSASPTYAPIIKVIGKAYCYRCFNEAHPEESHGKEHLLPPVTHRRLMTATTEAAVSEREFIAGVGGRPVVRSGQGLRVAEPGVAASGTERRPGPVWVGLGRRWSARVMGWAVGATS
uniref:Uncharacterized protein n=1 Tax=Aegilops tauschii subsp. strangulata TaxID=200361 RepID=A0A453G4M8_AEGTS